MTVPCEPDEDEDFETYNLTMNVTIRDDKIVAITDIYGDGSSTNDSYIKKATNGTSSKEGVISQIVNKGLPEEIDAKRAAEAATRAKERLRQRQSIMQYYQSQAALNRAMNRLKISRRHNHEI